jgi:hypothetical protein
MSLYVAPKQAIIDATNTQNATSLKLTDVTFGQVLVASDDVVSTTGKNSQVKLTGNGTTWSGSVVVNFNRLNLSDIGILTSTTLKVAAVDSVFDLVNYLNYFYGMVLTTDDLIDDPIALDDSGAGTVTVRANPTSYGWIGSIALTLVKGDAIVDYTLTDLSLDGINYPTGQSAKSQAPLVLYGWDFTAQKSALDAVTLNQVFTTIGGASPGGVLAAAILAVTGTTWTCSATAGAYNLYQGKVVYTGLNNAQLATNPAYKYVVMIQLADGSGANGTVATAYNNTFYGVIVLHYNDPEDPNAVQ